MSKLLWINPFGNDGSDQSIYAYLAPQLASDTVLRVTALPRGPEHVEYHYYESLILLDLLHTIKRAENDGFDAAVIGCFYDPGLREAREITERMVVTAPAEASMHIAGTLGHTFSIIVGRNKWIPQMHENVVKYGFRDRLASFKSVDLGVYDFMKDLNETNRRLTAAAREAVEQDRAEVIILGCTAQLGFFRELQELLGVPVIDVAVASLKYAEFLADLQKRLHWGHSKKYGYESPPIAEIESWKLAEQYQLGDLWKR
ncbi:MAG: aspartate/glutamate racemase family protein [Coprothermobacterota bacterium]|nr:aspartate/glutamate racemase family protein [Coprothermobacterota bacterium]